MTTPETPVGLGWPDEPRPVAADVAGEPAGLGWTAAGLPQFRVGEGAPLHPDGV